MINIPTELLRTLIAVVDLRSFTKAALSLGVTQPAVSAQIKRLQVLLGADIFDKSAPGVSVTPSGDLVINYARRMLSINDQIVDLTSPRLAARTFRVGVPGDFAALLLPPILADFRISYPDVRISVRSEHFDIMLRDLRQGDLDLLIGLSESGIMLDARHQWTEELVWVRGATLDLDSEMPVPLVTFGESCALHRAAITAFNKARSAFEVVFTGPSEASLSVAVRCGLGVTVLPRSRVSGTNLSIWEDAPLPAVGNLFCGIYLGENGDRPLLEQLADSIADVLNPVLRLRPQRPFMPTSAGMMDGR